MPRSRPSRWSLKLVLGSAVLFAAFFGLAMSGQTGGATFFSNPWLAGSITAAALGLLVLACAIAEVVLPH